MPTAGEHAIRIMEESLALYKERNAYYGDSFSRWGPVFTALFPDGVRVRTDDDWNRLTCLGHVIDKLVRYTTDFHRPHQDSIRDLGVYAHILEGLDAAASEHAADRSCSEPSEVGPRRVYGLGLKSS